MHQFSRTMLCGRAAAIMLTLSLAPQWTASADAAGYVAADVTPPRFDHEAMCTDGSVFSGFIDTTFVVEGLTEALVIFTEPVFDVGSTQSGTQPGTLTANAFTLAETSGAIPPTVLSAEHVDGDQSVVLIQWDRPITLEEWTTIIARVEDVYGNIIHDLPNLGPGVLERNRVDIGFLPADFDQNGRVSPFDILRFRQVINGSFEYPCLDAIDYVDCNGNLELDPFDLLVARQYIAGLEGVLPSMNHPQP